MSAWPASKACLDKATWSAPPPPTLLPSGLKQCSPYQTIPSGLHSTQPTTPSPTMQTCICGEIKPLTPPTVPGGPPEPRPCPKLLQGSMDLRRYNTRHDSVLTALYESIIQHLPKSASSTIDLGDKYAFPTHIVSTDLRPDIVWWDDTCRSVCLAELTVCFDTLSQDAAMR